MSLKSIIIFASSLLLCCPLHAQSVVQRATDFLNSLTPELKIKTQFTVTDSERFNMNYVPISRKGPTFNDFSEKQTKFALDLLKACLSEEGYRKASEITKLDKVLIKIEDNKMKMADGSPMRDPLNYHFCIFGEPGDGFWGWRFEGHHVSLNFSSINNTIVSSTPSFFGSNPAIVNIAGFDKQEVLKMETELGFSLVNSLTPGQLPKAKFSDTAPSEIITGNKLKVENIEPRGISFNELTDPQKKIFLSLLDVYLSNYELGFSKTLNDKIVRAGINNLSFSWAGSMAPGKGHYYRIQGPMLLIEYDNTQNNANHVHTIVRDLTNDFAEDILREHYQKDHK
ncbi:MAG: DUF3500 domain-containing protein [Cyclobacteriaceae bacterium]|nr:DUF3500 domain-containing protein [Cyclobacteriaceae bacterium]